ncbi:hypothetical protein F5X98DRAFT_336425 [Xylaria grammica]|nr:hypothetical protein F5X98DRAFT_336425 [Xylaria grammica]
MAGGLGATVCLSTEPHEDNITNPVLHFLGCIEIRERDAFLKAIIPIRQEGVEHQHRDPGSQRPPEVVDKMRMNWTTNIEREMKRIALLRYTLSVDDDDKHLVQEVDESRGVWRRLNQHTKRGTNSGIKSDFPPVTEGYVPEKDTSVPVIQFKDYEGFTDPDKRLSGEFPNQTTTIDQLLTESSPKENLLYNNRESDPNHIKYFHIPSNNMSWAEEAIARYYGEGTPELTKTRHQLLKPSNSSTYRILQDQYWHGRLDKDTGALPRERHMSPTCKRIIWHIEPGGEQKDIALFMPYLDWETSRRQEQCVHEIDNILVSTARTQLQEALLAKGKQREEMRQLPPWASDSRGQALHQPKSEDSLKEFEKVAKGVAPDHKKQNTSCKNPLARYLLAAAHLYEGMTTYRDRTLLRKYLLQKSPIHPRRTIDQAYYYWCSMPAKMWPENQVAHPGTTATRDIFHRFNENKSCPEHKGLGDIDYAICRAKIRKTSQIVMVDQLWMWILDAKTLITCFPKQYGGNGQDFSGIHESIRGRLENIGTGQIRTVFELALIVLECTTTLFNRDEPLDKRPQVISKLSSDIYQIKRQVALAEEPLWVKKRRPFTEFTGISRDGSLQQEIDAVIVELGIMLRISNTYKSIVKGFIEQAEHILNPSKDIPFGFERASLGGKDLSEKSKEYRDYLSFRLKANEFRKKVDGYVKDLRSLREDAESTARNAAILLNKQALQANIKSATHLDVTMYKGRAIVIFTLITVVFLPLSFLSSFYGMNYYDLVNRNWALGTFRFLIYSVILVGLPFAFTAFIWIRSLHFRGETESWKRSDTYPRFPERNRAEEVLDDTYGKLSTSKSGAKNRARQREQSPLTEGILGRHKRSEGFLRWPTPSLHTERSRGSMEFKKKRPSHGNPGDDTMPYSNANNTEVDIRSLPILIDRIFDLFTSLREPPVPYGKKRVRWTCQCGTRLFDDFVELKPGAIENLEAELREYGSTGRFEVLKQLGRLLAAGIKTWITLPFSRSRLKKSNAAPMPLPLHTTNAQTPSTAPSSGSNLRLLLCIEKGQFETKLHQKIVDGCSNDKEVFRFLHGEYHNYRKFRTWFTLRGISQLSLTRVSTS